MPKVTSVSPLAADPSLVKLILDDGAVVHVRRDGQAYEVGDEYAAPELVEAPAPVDPENEGDAE